MGLSSKPLLTTVNCSIICVSFLGSSDIILEGTFGTTKAAFGSGESSLTIDFSLLLGDFSGLYVSFLI